MSGNFDGSCAPAVKVIEDQLGPIEVLVNNAGITRDGFFHKMTSELWSDVIRVNMDSVFNMTRQVIEGMRERGYGRIINISSINGQKGQAGQDQLFLRRQGRDDRLHQGPGAGKRPQGITVNCICAGIHRHRGKWWLPCHRTSSTTSSPKFRSAV